METGLRSRENTEGGNKDFQTFELCKQVDSIKVNMPNSIFFNFD